MLQYFVQGHSNSLLKELVQNPMNGILIIIIWLGIIHTLVQPPKLTAMYDREFPQPQSARYIPRPKRQPDILKTLELVVITLSTPFVIA
jgi:hypothetical protein